MRPWLFISDLHLSPERPHIIDLFLRFATEVAPSAQRLFILGDLLEYWVGDDDPALELEPVFDALRTLREQGVVVDFMAGNRDFLVGEDLAKRAGFDLLAEPATVRIGGTDALLLHGDSLCVDDAAYQQFRSMVRDGRWQQVFLRRPLAERHAIAGDLRARSRQDSALKEEVIMDVNQDSVAAVMREHGVRLLIHGHTHRPAVHHFELDGAAATRVVLTDWYERGGYLELHGGEDAIRLTPFP